MLNLIFDTNIWIYLASGFNPLTEKYEEDLHFQLTNWINKEIKNKNCRLFTNYIIKIEWDRNKKKCNERIKKYEEQLINGSNKLKNKKKDTCYKQYAQDYRTFEKEIKEKIDKNKKHIKNIENIFKYAIIIPITDKQKLQAVELAIYKKPPFHHKNNSIADAIIFISTVEYFYYDEEFYIKDTIFISNDKSDFGESKSSKKLHPELSKMLADRPILFETNLAAALKLSDEIILKYQSYLDYLNRDFINCLMSCKGEEYGLAEVEFNKKVEIKISDYGYVFNPKQLLMDFGKDNSTTIQRQKIIEKKNYITVDIGECDFCNAIHIRCDCGEVLVSYDDEFECSCGKKYKMMDSNILLQDEE